MKKLLFAFLLALLMPALAKAVPAYPRAITYTQPNGDTLTVTLHGDEHIHWAVTTDGYTLLSNAQGYLSYAMQMGNGDLVPTNVAAKNVAQRTSQEQNYLQTVKRGLRYSPAQIQRAKVRRQNATGKPGKNIAAGGPQKSVVGTQKILVLLVSYSDVTFSHTTQDISNMYNQVGYSANNAVGSVHDFYAESSYNQMNLQADVFGPIQLSQNRDYYGGNDSDGDDSNPQAMVYQAVMKADSLYSNLNFSDYDLDGDGYVDCINVVFAGCGEEAGAPSSAIWSHKWAIPSTMLDGVYVSTYSCSPECRGGSGTNLTYIGVICHELGHVFGAADYYDIDYSGYNGTGDWDIMASGSWNNSGITPAHHNPYVKIYDYGWVTPTTLSNPQTITMQPSATSGAHYYKVNTATPNEFFILENKQQMGFDTHIPGHGLIIYRRASDMSSHGPNDDHPQGFYPVCASSTVALPTSSASSYGSIDSQGCPFPGSSNQTSFTDATTPSMKSWNGTNTAKPITNITENTSNHTITFDILGGQGDNPYNFTATLAYPDVNLSWQLNNNRSVLVVYNTVDQFGTPANNTTYTAGQTLQGGGTVLYAGSATSTVHTNVNLSTRYYYRIYSKVYSGNNYSYSTGIGADVFTGCGGTISNFPFVLDFESPIEDLCWSVDSTDNIFWKRGQAGEFPISLQPDGQYIGWMYASNYNDNYSNLTSPLLDFSNYTNPMVRYECIIPEWSGDQDTLYVQYRTGTSTTWTTAAVHATDASQMPLTDTIALPTNCTQVRFRGLAHYGYGIYIDDIIINATYAPQPGVAVNLSDTHCEGQPYTDNGFNIPTEQLQPGIQVFTRTSNDTTYMLTLTVNAFARQSETHEMCNGTNYTWHGHPFANTLPGHYIVNDTVPSATGCGTIYTLDLTVNAGYSAFINLEIGEDEVPYLWNGNTITTDGTYTYNGTTVHGCDSVIYLNVHICQFERDTIRRSICQGTGFVISGYSIPDVPGVYYYYDTIPATTGDCGKITTFELTVLATPNDTIHVEVSPSDLPYHWNGQDYYQSGFYTEYLSTSLGCDSIINLDLKVLNGLDYAEDGLFTISPNPVEKGGSVRLDVTLDEAERNGLIVEVFTSNGALVRREEPKEQPMTVKMPQEAGLYMVRLTTGSGRVLYGKVIVK